MTAISEVAESPSLCPGSALLPPFPPAVALPTSHSSFLYLHVISSLGTSDYTSPGTPLPDLVCVTVFWTSVFLPITFITLHIA